MADDWVITLSYKLDPSIDDMDAWEDSLTGRDAAVSRVPDRGLVDVTVYGPGATDITDMVTKIATEVGCVVRADPVGIEIIRESEFARRASAPTMPELMSAAEIAAELGVTRQRVHQLRITAAFPAPLADLRGGAVWDANAIRKFNQTWDRKPGRPPGANSNQALAQA